jgi:hypothetical protein
MSRRPGEWWRIVYTTWRFTRATERAAHHCLYLPLFIGLQRSQNPGTALERRGRFVAGGPLSVLGSQH